MAWIFKYIHAINNKTEKTERSVVNDFKSKKCCY